MRRLLPLILFFLLVSCGRPSAAALTPLPLAPTLPTLDEVLAAPEAGPVSAVGVLYVTDDGAALVDQLGIDSRGAVAPLDGEGIWLGQPATLPTEVRGLKPGERRSLVVAFSGSLAGPGSYGLVGQYRYSLDEPELTSLTSRDLTIALLLENSALYEGQPVRLQGQLLAGPGTALLIERLGPGGVPDARALQVKLAAPPRDPSLRAALSTSSGGRVIFGPVEITGLWRGGVLYPLTTAPR